MGKRRRRLTLPKQRRVGVARQPMKAPPAIKPARIGFELRVFLGVNCDHVDKVVTETHSMKWMCSGCERRLRPPGHARRPRGPLRGSGKAAGLSPRRTFKRPRALNS
jgi:hypothetical protein